MEQGKIITMTRLLWILSLFKKKLFPYVKPCPISASSVVAFIISVQMCDNNFTVFCMRGRRTRKRTQSELTRSLPKTFSLCPFGTIHSTCHRHSILFFVPLFLRIITTLSVTLRIHL